LQHKAQMVGLVCLDCKTVITEGTYVTALDNKHWHTPCFKCSRCSSKLKEYFEKVIAQSTTVAATAASRTHH
jgi:transcription initiation factor IIE alpha subunit